MLNHGSVEPGQVFRPKYPGRHLPANRADQPQQRGRHQPRQPVRVRPRVEWPVPEDRIHDRLAVGVVGGYPLDILGRVRHQVGEYAPLEMLAVLVERAFLLGVRGGRLPVAEEGRGPLVGQAIEELAFTVQQRVGRPDGVGALYPDQCGPVGVAVFVQPVGEHQPGQVVVRVGFDGRDQSGAIRHGAFVGWAEFSRPTGGALTGTVGLEDSAPPYGRPGTRPWKRVARSRATAEPVRTRPRPSRRIARSGDRCGEAISLR